MADKIPVKAIYTFADVTSLGEFNPGDTIPVANGGTGAVDATGARTNLGLASMAIQESNDVEITGGTIDGTVIGGTTPAAVNATTLSASGNVDGGALRSTGASVAATGVGAEVVYSGGVANFIGYNRSSGAYIPAKLNGLTSALQASGSDIAVASSTGLAVTGALSATAALTTNGLKEDAAGNLGLGVTPSAWSASFKAIEANGLAISGSPALPTFAAMFSNTYGDDAYLKYKAIGEASYYLQYEGGHKWFSAPSGTAGNPITFTQAMTLDASGNLAIVNGFGCNGATPQTKASVNAASTDLANVIVLCNQLRAALVANGICV